MNCRRIWQGMRIFTKYLGWYALVAPRRTLTFLRAVGHTALLHECAAGAQLPQRSYEDVFPGIERIPVTLTNVSPRDGNVSTLELYYLCAIARYRRVRSFFEIGTFNGLVTAHVALNTDSETRLITVDLGSEDASRLRWPLDAGEACYPQQGLGTKIQQLPKELRSRVQQLYGDSAQLDFSPYYGQMDVVFVDGSHRYEYVAHDSQEALRLRTPSGVILWHDYGVWPDVARYLNVLHHTHPLVHVSGTSLVVCLPTAEATPSDDGSHPRH